MTPGDGPLESNVLGLEMVEQGDLVVEGLLESPTVRAVRGPCDGIAVGQQPVARQGVAGVGRRQGIPRDHIAVAVKDEGAIPYGWHLDEEVGAIDGSSLGGDGVTYGGRAP